MVHLSFILTLSDPGLTIKPFFFHLQILEEKPIHTLSMSGMGTLPPGPPLAGLATLGFAPTAAKEWDQMSMYSQHSQHSRLPGAASRARMYQMDRPGESLIGLSVRLR